MNDTIAHVKQYIEERGAPDSVEVLPPDSVFDDRAVGSVWSGAFYAGEANKKFKYTIKLPDSLLVLWWKV